MTITSTNFQMTTMIPLTTPFESIKHIERRRFAGKFA